MKCTIDIEKCGGVWTRDVLDAKLNSALDDKTITENLKSQIKFHKRFTCTGPSHPFSV